MSSERGAGFGLFFALAGGLGLAFAGTIARAKTTGAPHGKSLRTLIGALLWNGFVGGIACYLFFVEDREEVATGPRIIIGLFLLAGMRLLVEGCTQLLQARPLRRERAWSLGGSNP